MTKPFDLPAFKAFVEGKDPSEEFDWSDDRLCALGQFGFQGVDSRNANKHGVPSDVYWAAIKHPSTFGSLAERLNKLGEVEQ